MPDGKIALVTGATAGMGREIALQLAAAGHTVLVGARDAAKGEAVVAAVKAAGGNASPILIDVTDPSSADAAARLVADAHGRLDILINNAGISLDHDKQPTDTSLDAFRRTFETNVFGVATVTNAFLPLLLKSPDGRIINQSAGLGVHSVVARLAPPMANMRFTAYAASKGALNSLTLEYAKFLRDTPVKIYATAPGVISTALNGFKPMGASPAEGAGVAVDLATRTEAAPNGSLWGRQGRMEW